MFEPENKQKKYLHEILQLLTAEEGELSFRHLKLFLVSFFRKQINSKRLRRKRGRKVFFVLNMLCLFYGH